MNPNLVLAQAFVDELAHGGVQEVGIAPGSRSTPLTLAFFHQPGIHVYMHLDERSAAFFALGLSLAHNRPVPVVCTSGSAPQFHAAMSKRMSGVPVVLTTDRPTNKRGSAPTRPLTSQAVPIRCCSRRPLLPEWIV
jgi:2-succinyl-5-enolpyruvyl-6-hydroxy-3-cyclohexene-1-carboxylate synthase